MSDNNTDNNENNSEESNKDEKAGSQNTPNSDTGSDSRDASLDKLVSERVSAELKEIKSSLDKAYEARDKALRELAAREQREKEERVKRLQEEGKQVEALTLQLEEERAARKEIEKRNTELSRDVSVRTAMKSLDFRNDKAADMAFKEIVAQLVQDDNGVWMHKSGKSIELFMKEFSDSEDQAFLFKPKVSSGGGSGNERPGSGSGKKSIFELSQAEVLARAANGTLRK